MWTNRSHNIQYQLKIPSHDVLSRLRAVEARRHFLLTVLSETEFTLHRASPEGFSLLDFAAGARGPSYSPPPFLRARIERTGKKGKHTKIFGTTTMTRGRLVNDRIAAVIVGTCLIFGGIVTTLDDNRSMMDIALFAVLCLIVCLGAAAYIIDLQRSIEKQAAEFKRVLDDINRDVLMGQTSIP